MLLYISYGMDKHFPPQDLEERTSGNEFVETGGDKYCTASCTLQHVPLTDRLRLEELSGAAFTFTLAVDG